MNGLHHRNPRTEDSNISLGYKANGTTTKKRQRHSKLWYEDGSVVLATETTLFRVYRGILSQNSVIFRNMFSLPRSPSSTEEKLDGLPLIHLHDAAEDLAHLLMTLHDQSYYKIHEPCDFSFIVMLLRLSTKYEIHNLRQQTIAHLSYLYPNSRDEFDAFPDPRRLILAQDDVTMLLVARETQANVLIPVAFYRIVVNVMQDLYKDDTDSKTNLGRLTREDLMSCIIGREKLRRAIRNEIGSFLDEASPVLCGGEHCKPRKRSFLASKVWKNWTDSPRALDEELVDDITTSLDKLCEECVDALDISTREGRQRIWDKLPSYFGLPNWEALKASTSIVGGDGDLR